MKKKMLVLVLAGIMAVASLTGCKSVKTVNSEDVLMTVNGEEVTAGVANFYARYTQAQYESIFGAYMGENIWSSEAEEGVSYEESVKASVLETIQMMVLSEQHMADFDVELTEDDKALIAKAAKEFDDVNSQENKEKVSGDPAIVERVMTLQVIGQKVQQAIYDSVDQEVSDDEAAQKKMEYIFLSYESADEEGNTVELTADEKAALKDQAGTVKASVESGKTMDTAASLIETEVKELTFDAESQALSEEVIKAADALEEGEVSEVIETEEGLYVVKLVSLFDKEATETQKELILNERQSSEYETYCAEWMEAAEVEVNEELWEKVDFESLSVIMVQDESEAYADEVVTDDVAE